MTTTWTTDKGPTRGCGSCSLCCKLLDVPQLDAPAGEWCRHCRPGEPGGGCDVHNLRPKVCRTFQCLWTFGLGEDRHRPDRIGGFFAVQPGSVETEAYHDPGRGLIAYVTERAPRKIQADVRRLIDATRRAGFAVAVARPNGSNSVLLPSLTGGGGRRT